MSQKSLFVLNSSDKIKSLVFAWLKQLQTYDPQKNLLERTSKEKYKSKCLYALLKLNDLRILSIADIIAPTDEITRYFHDQIIRSDSEGVQPFRFKKENNKYVVDSKGSYYLSVSACYNSKENNIYLVENALKSLCFDFHPELFHSIQMQRGFYHIDSFLPLAKEFNLLLSEGEADYNVNLIDPQKNLAQNAIGSYTYNVYEFLFRAIMSKIPVKFRSIWLYKNLEEFIFFYPENELKSLAELFAITIYILSKVEKYSFDQIWEQTVQFQQVTQSLLTETHKQLQNVQPKEEELAYARQKIMELKNILEKKDELQQSFQTYRQSIACGAKVFPESIKQLCIREIQKVTLEEYKQKVVREIQTHQQLLTAYHKNQGIKKSMIKEQKYYQWCSKIAFYLQNYLEQRPSVEACLKKMGANLTKEQNELTLSYRKEK